MKLDCLVIAAHPDDAEISVGGTILRLVASGRRVGIVDLTRGELGTRGSAEDRARECAQATELLGIDVRENLDLSDGRVESGIEAREKLAALLVRHRPGLILAHHTDDLHPDHAAAGALARTAWYLSGLSRLAERLGGDPAGEGRPRRARHLFHFMGHVPFEPTLVVNVDDVWERKVEVIRAYASQLEPSSPEDRGEHLLFGADILRRAETKARAYGERIGCRYGEPLLHHGPLDADPWI